MATLSRRHHHVVCALVSALPHLGGTDGRNDEGKRSGQQPQLCVALGSDLTAGTGQALPTASEPTNRSWRMDETYSVDLSPFLRQTVKSQNSLRRIDSWGCLDENSPRN